MDREEIEAKLKAKFEDYVTEMIRHEDDEAKFLSEPGEDDWTHSKRGTLLVNGLMNRAGEVVQKAIQDPVLPGGEDQIREGRFDYFVTDALLAAVLSGSHFEIGVFVVDLPASHTGQDAVDVVITVDDQKPAFDALRRAFEKSCSNNGIDFSCTDVTNSIRALATRLIKEGRKSRHLGDWPRVDRFTPSAATRTLAGRSDETILDEITYGPVGSPDPDRWWVVMMVTDPKIPHR